MKTSTRLLQFGLTWITLLWSGVRCTGALSNGGSLETTSTPIPGVPPAGTAAVITGDWSVIPHTVRDVLVLPQELVLISDSAPRWAKGPDDTPPYIAALDLHTGVILWETQYTPVAPITANTQAMFVVEDTRLVAVQLQGGKEVWSAPLDGSGFVQVFSDEDLVLVANPRALYAFDAQSGEVRWESSVPIPLDLSVPDPVDFDQWRQYRALAKHGQYVYARRKDASASNTCQTSLIALDATTGKEAWRYSARQPSMVGEGCSPGTLSLSFDSGIVLTGSWFPSQCHFSALDEKSGHIVWTYIQENDCALDARSGVSLRGRFVVATHRDVLYLDSQTGQLVEDLLKPLGEGHQRTSTSGLVVARLSNGTTYRVMELQTGVIVDLDVPPMPTGCQASTRSFGLSGGRIVLADGNCLWATLPVLWGASSK